MEKLWNMQQLKIHIRQCDASPEADNTLELSIIIGHVLDNISSLLLAILDLLVAHDLYLNCVHIIIL